ncbi:MAG: hypothetical protein ACD_3C00196G0003 [uncultured bacterium (gcode 4)]|uniref:Uncharacterized protein n=1 Tax=uncultured bacterium (gcode 4) TaxID=1234023 RepID=K2GVZ5_9BACT|nr:MAG: hypothetical protein ACD_3C00196G0003 [uncultured bacterium (gcode 4)]
MNWLAEWTKNTSTREAQLWRTGIQAKANSTKIETILLSWPQTSSHINKKWILVYDNGILMLFWKVADRKNKCLQRKNTEIRPTINVSKQIEQWLNDDLKNWWRGNIHHLKANPETVKCLFIEWVITHSMLKNAHVTDWVVIISMVYFESIDWKMALTILCSPEFEFDYASVDNRWKIIE